LYQGTNFPGPHHFFIFLFSHFLIFSILPNPSSPLVSQTPSNSLLSTSLSLSPSSLSNLHSHALLYLALSLMVSSSLLYFLLRSDPQLSFLLKPISQILSSLLCSLPRRCWSLSLSNDSGGWGWIAIESFWRWLWLDRIFWVQIQFNI